MRPRPPRPGPERWPRRSSGPRPRWPALRGRWARWPPLRRRQGGQEARGAADRACPPGRGAPCVALAGQQHLVEALGLAEGIAALQQADDGGGIQVTAAVDVAVLARHHVGQLAHFHRHPPALADRAQQPGAALLVADVARQRVGRRRALAEVVHQAGEAHGQRRREAGRHVEHHHEVHAGVDFGVVRLGLGHAPQAVHLGQQHREGAAVAQQLEHARGPAFHQAARELLPDALGHQRVDLAGRDHLAHQRQRSRARRRSRRSAPRSARPAGCAPGLRGRPRSRGAAACAAGRAGRGTGRPGRPGRCPAGPTRRACPPAARSR